jgi:hypothetical protein
VNKCVVLRLGLQQSVAYHGVVSLRLVQSNVHWRAPAVRLMYISRVKKAELVKRGERLDKVETSGTWNRRVGSWRDGRR